MTERLPPPDPALFPRLAAGHVHVLDPDRLLGRIHATAGRHPTAWRGFRFFGPTSARFDHHPPPPRRHPVRAVLYAVSTVIGRQDGQPPVLRTCVNEVFGDRGAVELSRDGPFFVLFRPVRPLRLLDLADSDWVARAGGNAAISSGLRSTARRWSRAIYRHYQAEDTVDGLLYVTSTMPPARSVVLFERAADALPARPLAHLPLTHPALRAELESYAADLHLHLLP